MYFRSPFARLAAGVLLSAVLFVEPAFALSWNRVATVNSATATDTAVCSWSASGSGTLNCSPTNPDIVGGFLGIGTSSPGDTLTVNGTVGYMLGTDLTTTGAQNNVVIGTASALRYNGTATATFTGIAAGANGQILYLHNPSAYTLTLSNQSASSSAANRIVTGTGADLSVPSNTSVMMQYDTTASLWRVTGSSNSANTLAAGTTGQVQFNGGTNLAADSNLFWDNTNKRLGIGTTGPSTALTVAGTILATAASGVGSEPGTINLGIAGTNNGSVHFFNGSTTTGQADLGYINGAGAGAFSIFSGGGSGTISLANGAGTALFVSSAANVGIGTTSPNTKLQVATGNVLFGDVYNYAVPTPATKLNIIDNAPLITIQHDPNYGSGSAGIEFEPAGSGAASGDYKIYGSPAGGSFGSGLIFELGNLGAIGGGTFVMKLDGSGNVGIGSTVPITSLDLSAKTDAVALPVGTTANRPTGVAVSNGEIRYNTNLPGVEAYVNGAWSTLQGSGTSGGVLPVANGGTGDSTLTAYGLMMGNGTSPVTAVGPGTSAQMLISQGASASPTFNTLSQDVTITNLGVTTVGKIQNVAVGSPTGTAGSAVVLATSPTIAAPTLTGTTAGANLTLSGTEVLSFGTNYSTTGANADVSTGGSSSIRYTGASAGTIYGFVAGTNGQVLNLHNDSSATLTLANLSGSEATGANKIITSTGADMKLLANAAVQLQYDATANGASGAWRVTGSSLSAVAQAAGSDKQIQYNNNGTMSGSSGLVFDYSTGNVGIGTTSPSYPLDVSGIIHNTGAAYLSSTNYSNTVPTVQVGDGQYGISSIGGGLYLFSNALGGYIDFVTKTSGGVQNTNMTILSNGNVGIGTTSPAAGLDNETGSMRLGGTSPYFTFYASGQATDQKYWDIYDVGTVLAFRASNDAYTLATNWMQVNRGGSYGISSVVFPNGNVGIGTTSPGSKLQVNGGAAIGYATSTAAPSNGLAVSGTVAIGTTSPAADVKEDVAGAVKLAGTGSEVCGTTADVGKFRYNATGGYFELCAP